jgi:hypothetical protein
VSRNEPPPKSTSITSRRALQIYPLAVSLQRYCRRVHVFNGKIWLCCQCNVYPSQQQIRQRTCPSSVLIMAEGHRHVHRYTPHDHHRVSKQAVACEVVTFRHILNTSECSSQVGTSHWPSAQNLAGRKLLTHLYYRLVRHLTRTSHRGAIPV